MTTIDKINTQTAINVTDLGKTIAKLVKQRETWENGSYKQSNNDLYAILEQCGTIYAAVREDDTNARALNAVAEELGVVFTKGTSAALKVVRIVFGKQGDREFAYARVLKVWFDERTDNQTVTNFLIGRGGIEEVRRASKKKASPLHTDDYREIAAAALVEGATLSTLSITNAMISDDKNDTGYIVALIRNMNDGSGAVLYATNKASLVNAALAATGKELHELQEHEDSETAATEKRDLTLDNVKKFIARQRTNAEKLSAA